ncbi:alpha-L-fucosidase [Brachybacterium sp. MASK1Z-5]|uniref:alpha-L-fucosidase n=1 Tax=Brachybacterium halotolerans TaxID=2795215 RepID=A0ABS1BED8_9MICO|nr:alpha-L-fucosidase [Brachybacterium halotolerans]MBK0332969.1 alpha-L-fucosidase [Brachybacterium halotolerans]
MSDDVHPESPQRPVPPLQPSDPLRPTTEQLAWQREGLGVFFHVGVNTFAGLEWSDGTLSPGIFDPTDLDADEWVRTAHDLGAAYVVLTAKHHDGFCLWPTATTDYSVRASPWRQGRGDLVAEVAAACERWGLGLGLYLSPWDRHAPEYADPARYDAFYLAQLRELCTGYGPLHELWFDGAGSAGREYDWEAIGDLVDELQPGAMVFNMGRATIRWVGNEDGLASDPVEYVTTSADLNNYDDDVIETAAPRYLPPECDVSLRDGWFWQEGEQPKSLPHLLAIHDRSIGLGANLLLNIPPDRRGRIDPADASRVSELAGALHARFGSPIPARCEPASAVLRLPGPTTFDHVELREHLEDGQRIRRHRILDAEGRELAAGGTVGVRRIHRLAAPVTAEVLQLEIEGEGAALDAACVHDARGTVVPDLSGSRRAPTTAPDGPLPE